MKKLIIICLLTASLHARADVVVVETMKNGDQTVTITTKIKGDKSRTDIVNQSADTSGASQSSIIANLATGDIITLVHEAKSYVKFTADKAKLIVGDIQKSKGDAVAAPKIEDTGKKETVNGYATEIYKAETPAAKFTYWVTKDYPDFATIQGEMRKFHARQDDLKRKLGMKDDLGPDIWKVEGLAVKTETTNTKGDVSDTTLVSAKEQAVDDADFQIPAGYTDMESHASPSPAPAGGTPEAKP